MFSVGDGVSDDVCKDSVSALLVISQSLEGLLTLKEDLEDTTSLFVDQTRDTLDTTTTSETADSWLCDTLDVVSQDLAVSLSTTFAESLSACINNGRQRMSTNNEARSPSCSPLPRPDMIASGC